MSCWKKKKMELIGYVAYGKVNLHRAHEAKMALK